ncbi:gp54 [Lomovskayavirus C31]|uniref:Gp54 n=1 Tax=Streptomyces phage phiC31 TaxID=10719 RepID=Q9ZX96_BPPHC|nr:gp54 [Lomovskayavirus C31]CAA07124.1 gp54 [Lomovskayavirus C31]
MPGYMVVESLFADGKTHAVLKDSATPQTTECGTAAGFPVGGSTPPTCTPCAEAVRDA